MVELLKGLRFETLRGVGTVLGWIQGTFNAFILKSLVFESFEREMGYQSVANANYLFLVLVFLYSSVTPNNLCPCIITTLLYF